MNIGGKLAAAGAIGLALAFAPMSAGAQSANSTTQIAQFRPGAQVPEAGEFIAKLADRAIKSLVDKSVALEERKARFRELLADGFDVPAIGRFVLGRYVRLATEAELKEFLQLFEDFIVNAYAARFGEYAGENLRIGQARAESATEATVFSDLVRPAGPPVKVEWRVARQQNANFKIVDVVVEGVSMSITQRDDFSAQIQRGGGKVDALLVALRDKVRTGAAK